MSFVRTRAARLAALSVAAATIAAGCSTDEATSPATSAVQATTSSTSSAAPEATSSTTEVAPTTHPSTTLPPTTVPAPTSAPATTAAPSTVPLGTPDNPEPLTEEAIRAAVADYERRLEECSALLTSCDYDILRGRATGRVLQFEILIHGDFSAAGRWVDYTFEVRDVEINVDEETARAHICEFGRFLDDPDETTIVLSRSSLDLKLSDGAWRVFEDDVWPGYVIYESPIPEECDA